MPLCEGHPGAGFQIALERNSPAFIGKLDCDVD
jgi:hypothetical protein